MTIIRISAEGHLGKFEKEYFIPQGNEWPATARMMRELFNYVRKGWGEQWQNLLSALEELEKIEKERGEKSG